MFSLVSRCLFPILLIINLHRYLVDRIKAKEGFELVYDKVGKFRANAFSETNAPSAYQLTVLLSFYTRKRAE